MRLRRLSDSRLRIVVAGYLLRAPLGGISWHYLNYLCGLAGMGHDVWYLEDSDEYPACYDPSMDDMTADPSYGLEFVQLAMRRIGLADRWAYHDFHSSSWKGAAASELVDVCRSADLLIDISGVNPWRPWTEAIPVRAVLDTDPAFTQIRNIQDPERRAHISGFTSWFTFASAIGDEGAAVPDDGFRWRPTRQPVALEQWPVTSPRRGPFTTVMQWVAYEPVSHGGVAYGNKDRSFPLVEALPARIDADFVVALGSADQAVSDRLAGAGWRVVDPRAPTRDPWTYQEFIATSLAELAVAKHGYVASRSGWFSERSTSYLASGRPVIAQDTGYSRWLPTGRGLFAFSTEDEAAAAVEEVMGNPGLHAAAARELSEDQFRAPRVLGDLIEDAFQDA